MMTKTPHDSLLLNIYKNVQLKTEWGGYVQMQLRGTERLAPPGGPHTHRSSRRRRFSFGSQITFNGLRSCTLRCALPPQSQNNFPFAPLRTLGRLCLSASNIAKGISSCISRPINNSTKQEGLKLKSWWRSDARQCLCESVSHLLRQCTRASVGIVSAVERIGNNAIRSRLGGSMGGTRQHCVTPSMVTESQAEAKMWNVLLMFNWVAVWRPHIFISESHNFSHK